MRFSNASTIEQTCWDMRLADIPRGTNRSLINSLANGFPPYTTEEQAENGIQTNANFLEMAKIAADARRQFCNAFLKPGQFFSVTVNHGPVWKRREWSSIISKEISSAMKGSLRYIETLRSVFANVVLHGIGPVAWADKERWVPEALGVEDVLVPSNTLLTLDNLQHFAVFRQYTAAQLWKATHGPKVDPAWNIPLVNAALKWADEQTSAQISYAETYSPEKLQERFKQDLGYYASDAVPTIDVYDFYFFEDVGKQSGWQRRIVLDTPCSYEFGSGGNKSMPNKNLIGEDHGHFLYNPGNRIYADKINQILHFQFGDGNAVAPFRYHSVRSLGFLLYAVCHLQNRLRCKFNDAVFESLLQYFKVNSPDDAERLTKVDLQDKGIIPDGLEFVKAQDRWQVNEALIGSAIQFNRQTMAEASSSFTQNTELARKEQLDETATAVMARVNAANSLLSAMLIQAYAYQKFQYTEICRRFCKPNSIDPDVRKFRLNCLKQGVPEDVLNHELWDIEPERVLGAGNKMMEIAIAEKLMAIRPLLDPEPQREVLHGYVLAISDDYAMANRVVPIQKQQVTDSVHDAQLASAALMMGLPVSIKTGMNHIEYVETMLSSMGSIIQKIEQRGGMAKEDEILGLQNISTHVAEHIAIISQDKNEKQRVKQYGDVLAKAMNMVRAYAQRLQQARQERAQGNGGMDPKDQAKIQAQLITAQAKAANTRESHGQRTAQRQVSFEQKMRQDEQKHQLEMRRQTQQNALDAQTQILQAQVDANLSGIKTATDIRNQQKKTEQETQTTNEE